MFAALIDPDLGSNARTASHIHCSPICCSGRKLRGFKARFYREDHKCAFLFEGHDKGFRSVSSSLLSVTSWALRLSNVRFSPSRKEKY